ncbi:MAG TPA: hypothetical protein VGH01_08305 [Jatrophihabitantaceae bacterium]
MSKFAPFPAGEVLSLARAPVLLVGASPLIGEPSLLLQLASSGRAATLLLVDRSTLAAVLLFPTGPIRGCGGFGRDLSRAPFILVAALLSIAARIFSPGLVRPPLLLISAPLVVLTRGSLGGATLIDLAPCLLRPALLLGLPFFGDPAFGFGAPLLFGLALLLGKARLGLTHLFLATRLLGPAVLFGPPLELGTACLLLTAHLFREASLLGPPALLCLALPLLASRDLGATRLFLAPHLLGQACCLGPPASLRQLNRLGVPGVLVHCVVTVRHRLRRLPRRPRRSFGRLESRRVIRLLAGLSVRLAPTAPIAPRLVVHAEVVHRRQTFRRNTRLRTRHAGFGISAGVHQFIAARWPFGPRALRAQRTGATGVRLSGGLCRGRGPLGILRIATGP